MIWLKTIFQTVGIHCLDIEPSPMFQSVFGVSLIVVEFIVPLVILIYCYGRMLWIIRARIGSKMGSQDALTAKFELAKSNVIKTLFLVAFWFFICYVGSEMFDLFFYLGFEIDWNGSYFKFVVSMLFLNCTINPFIYLLNYKDFQKALMEQFHCRTSQSSSNSNPTGSIEAIFVKSCDSHIATNAEQGTSENSELSEKWCWSFFTVVVYEDYFSFSKVQGN